MVLLYCSTGAVADENDLWGWQVQQVGNTWVYSPSGLGRGAFFNITLFPAVEIENRRHLEWFNRFLAKDEGKLGKVTRRGKLKQDNRRTWAIAMQFISRNGAKRQAIYVSPKLKGSRVGILRVIYSDMDTFSKYKYGLKKVAELLDSGLYNSMTELDGKRSSEIQAQRERPAFRGSDANVDISELIYFGTVDFGINGAYSRYGVIALMADNICTKDIDVLLQGGVAVSKRKHLQAWGECRIRDGKLEMRWGDEKSYEEMEGFYEKLKPLAVDERLFGCWKKTSGYGNAVLGTTSIAQDKWCFDRNGRFSNEGFVGITGSATTGGSHSVGTGYADSSKSGWYRIDGRIVRLVYDSGKKITKVIGLDREGEEGKSTLILGGEVFFQQLGAR